MAVLKSIIVDDEELSRNIIQNFVDKTDNLESLAQCEDGIQASNFLAKKEVDVIFLDIEMPEMSGMDLIKSLSKPPMVILITSKKEHAIEAFEYNVVDYVLKPFDYARFSKAVNKAREIYKQSNDTHDDDADIYVRVDSRLVKIKASEVYWIEALGDYIVINTEDSKYIVHNTMKGIESKLSPDKFLRVHRSYIVRLERIETLDESVIVIKQKIIPIGGTYKSRLMNRLNMV
ncbi:MAG: response regulator transcription factor [Bacteroidetes bacterium]|nr:response regulator transcription factor [Bacteroidota bacterium]